MARSTDGLDIVQADLAPAAPEQTPAGSLLRWAGDQWTYKTHRVPSRGHAASVAAGDMVIELEDGSRRVASEAERLEFGGTATFFSGTAFQSMIDRLSAGDGDWEVPVGCTHRGLPVIRARRFNGFPGSMLTPGGCLPAVLLSRGQAGGRATATVPNDGDWVVETQEGLNLVAPFEAMRMGLRTQKGPTVRYRSFLAWLLSGRMCVSPGLAGILGLGATALFFWGFSTVMAVAFPPPPEAQEWTFTLQGRSVMDPLADTSEQQMSAASSDTAVLTVWGELRGVTSRRMVSCQVDAYGWSVLGRYENGTALKRRVPSGLDDCEGVRWMSGSNAVVRRDPATLLLKQ